MMCVDKLERGWPIGGYVHAKSVVFQAPRQHVPVQGFIVYQQQMVVLVHIM